MPTIGEFTVAQWGTYGISVLLVGFSKTAAPGIGVAVVALLASAFPARASTGLLLTVLITGDIIAVISYRRSAEWWLVGRLLPWTAVGVVVGFLLLGQIDDRQLAILMAAIVVSLVGATMALNATIDLGERIPRRWWFAATMGTLAGVTTMLSNAAGPLVTVYLLAMSLPKQEFLGTGAWFYLLVNLLKVPFSASLGLITPATLLMNAAAIPVVMAGGLLGIQLIKRIPEQIFGIAMRVLAVAAAARLAVWALL